MYKRRGVHFYGHIIPFKRGYDILLTFYVNFEIYGHGLFWRKHLDHSIVVIYVCQSLRVGRRIHLELRIQVLLDYMYAF